MKAPFRHTAAVQAAKIALAGYYPVYEVRKTRPHKYQASKVRDIKYLKTKGKANASRVGRESEGTDTMEGS
jgi:hypothetical protein